MDKKQALVKNTLIIALGNMSVQFVSFLLLPFYTKYLSTSDYGVVDLISTYTLLLVPVITLQLNMAAFRFLIDIRDDADAKTEVVTNTLYVAGLVSVVFMAITLGVFHFIHILYAYLALLNICAAIIPSMFLQFARGFGKNNLFAIGCFIAGFTAIVLNIVLIAGYHMGARGMLTAGIIANTVAGAYLFIVLKLYRYINISTINKKLLSKLLKYALPLVPNGVSWWVIDASDRTIISIVLGLSSNGIYAVAYKFPTAFGAIFSFFSMSWTESASMHINSKGRDTFFSEVGSASIRFFGSLAAVMLAYIAVFFNVFIGVHYRQAYMYIPILVVAAFFNSVVGVYSGIYIANKFTKQVATTSIFAGIINLVLSIALIKFIGMYGTALATAIAYMAMAIYRHYDSKKFVNLKYEKNLFIKIIIFFGLACLSYYFNHSLLNILFAVLATIVALFMNRSMISVIKERIFLRLRKLSPEQDAASRFL